MSIAKLSYVTTTRDYIAVKPDGEVVICRRDMRSGKEMIMSLRVDLRNGKIYAIKRPPTAGGGDAL